MKGNCHNNIKEKKTHQKSKKHKENWTKSTMVIVQNWTKLQSKTKLDVTMIKLPNITETNSKPN